MKNTTAGLKMSVTEYNENFVCLYVCVSFEIKYILRIDLKRK